MIESLSPFTLHILALCQFVLPPLVSRTTSRKNDVARVSPGDTSLPKCQQDLTGLLVSLSLLLVSCRHIRGNVQVF